LPIVLESLAAGASVAAGFIATGVSSFDKAMSGRPIDNEELMIRSVRKYRMQKPIKLGFMFQ